MCIVLVTYVQSACNSTFIFVFFSAVEHVLDEKKAIEIKSLLLFLSFGLILSPDQSRDMLVWWSSWLILDSI